MIKDDIRVRNPFHDPLVTELIEEPGLYYRMFSEQILVGETLAVFQPANVVLVGPQGSGKSMILNLIRHGVLSEWISKHGRAPSPLKHVAPFLGISVNLVRANFHAFGRRSVSRTIRGGQADPTIDSACAADFLNHYLFREFLNAFQFLKDECGGRFSRWLGIDARHLGDVDIVAAISSWNCWFGYYSDCVSLEALLAKCERRLSVWRSFLNANTDEIDPEVWETKSNIGEPLHAMGNVLKRITSPNVRVPLFVVIDQYEVLPELNPGYGTSLQRVVNELIKARDPVVFYKIGARTYDWGKELRVWGAESRIEVQRDYVMINLADLLMRDENVRSWLFQKLALDIIHKRIKVQGHYRIKQEEIESIFGGWIPQEESYRYFNDKSRRSNVLKGVPDSIAKRIEAICGLDPSPLELRLAAAWVLQRQQRVIPEAAIVAELESRPWQRPWWRKERIGVALLQIASLANQRRLYYGWKTLLFLSGGNISALLNMCSEIWDMASKVGIHPLKASPVPADVQTEAILLASEKWRIRDRNELAGGRKRYEVLSRLGPAIRAALVNDLAISNPGHSGFSLRESDLSASEGPGGERPARVAEFLQNAVNWAIFEERPHTSKRRGGEARRKWYFHPLLSPAFGIPYIRVKEPLYATLDDVYDWIFGYGPVKFRPTDRLRSNKRQRSTGQLRMRLEDPT